MNQIVASNIRLMREHRAWTQEHLAQVAGVTPRTVQRVEAGGSVQDQTLMVLAAALDVDVQTLRFDALEYIAQQLGIKRDEVTPELVAQRQKEMNAMYTKVATARVAASADLRAVSDATSLSFDCILKDDGVQNIAAAFEQELHDLMDIGRDADATHRREFEVSAFEYVRELEKLGAIVSIGRRNGRIKLGNGESMPWICVYVIVSSHDDASDVVLVPKSGSVSGA